MFTFIITISHAHTHTYMHTHTHTHTGTTGARSQELCPGRTSAWRGVVHRFQGYRELAETHGGDPTPSDKIAGHSHLGSRPSFQEDRKPSLYQSLSQLVCDPGYPVIHLLYGLVMRFAFYVSFVGLLIAVTVTVGCHMTVTVWLPHDITS